LRDAKLFDEDKDADYREGAYDLDYDVDYVTGFALVGALEEEESEH
jgi:hypothetical protein